MLVSKAIPSMFNGVSQQPAPLRHPSQCEIQDNAFPAVATGLRKRPPSFHLAKIQTATFGEVFAHTINRDTTERYEVLVTDGDLMVYDLISLSQKTVNFPDGKGYLDCTKASTDFGLVTVADHTFVVNKTKVAAMDPTTHATNPVNVAYVYVASAPSQHAFTVKVDGVTSTVALGSEGGTQAYVSANLATALATALGVNYTVTRVTETLNKITKVDGTAITVSSSDTYGDTAIRVVSNGVPRFSDLPARFDVNYIIKVTGDPGNNEDEYYVEFKNGTWVETVAPGSVNGFDASTLPHLLVRNSDGTFTFKKAEWNPRKAGDAETNPLPTFVGRTINDIFFFRNRLGLLSDENIVMSRAGEFYSFFGETVRAVLDSDPIDVAASSTKVSILRYAVDFDKVLLLFSDQSQFQLSGGDILSPKTAKISPVTAFESSKDCRPVAIGRELFFPVTRGNSTGIREYFVDDNTVTNDAVEVTAHVPQYIPSGVFKLASSSNEDLLMALTSNERNVAYLYKFYWNKNEKMQSAWGRIVFAPTDVILNATFVANFCYLIIQRADGVYLELMDFQPYLEDTGLGFQVHLDRRCMANGVYDSATNLTTWQLPYTDAGNFTVVLGAAFGSKAGASLLTTRPSSSTIAAKGDFSAHPVIIGRNYRMQYRLSEQYALDRNNVAILNAEVKLRKFYLNYFKSSHFAVEVTPKARSTYRYPFNGKKLGAAQLVLGKPSVDSGSFSFPVQTSSSGVTIDIINDSYLPSTFQSAEWEGELVTLSRRL